LAVRKHFGTASPHLPDAPQTQRSGVHGRRNQKIELQKSELQTIYG
jgi:hypothetical protein